MPPASHQSSHKAGSDAMSMIVRNEVRNALAAGGPVVALESTLLAHGIPRPRNQALAFELEAAVRAEGATPATIAVLNGALRVGLDAAGREAITLREDVLKCTLRDLPLALARRVPGATTVASTLFVARRAGIGFFATGGIGGVHRGGEVSLDESADLVELARSPLVVVASGAKSILDLPRTLERLETLGVTVVGYQCEQLPGFYTAETGLAIPGVTDFATLVEVVRAHRALGLPGALLVAQPPPAELAMSRAEVDELVRDARAAAQTAGIQGPAETPFLLAHMSRASGGATTRLNCALVLANAGLAARLAEAIST